MSHADSKPIIAVEDLHFGFPSGPELVCQDHAWGAGLHLIQGDEGVGKTALLCTLAGDVRPIAGRVLGNARDVFWQHPRAELNEAERQMTCSDWVAQRAKPFAHWSAADFDRHAAGFGLSEHMHKPLLALSTGSLRKLWMATAWASGAALVLIDEPLAALDKGSMRYVETTLNEFGLLRQHARCVIVTHWDAMQHVDWDDVFTLG
ncbi:ABC transporter ATP-binding protein [Diaphorobacter caeni]|uniref:ABC transporter ATP-binding protein n=1 Tax=Diaphorobacter caeni TaxID=2784387 RepID=UPI00188E60AC|nr:ATP-binding cassette domain-containing protein [Diaphorobacter caeni]MBF5007066.1 ATP-binding cassette domain-containing protein [Diaphorobacter caeni]